MATNWRYYLDFLTAPLAAVTLLTYSRPSLSAALSFALGYLAWVFIEWFVHAQVLHSPKLYRREHWVHHLRPSDTQVNEKLPWFLTNGALFVSILLGIASGPEAAAFQAALVLGYASYITAHHAMHHGWLTAASPGFLGAAVRRHELHHRGLEGNFNVLCPLADQLLRTYVKA